MSDKKIIGSGGSRVVEDCQVCKSKDLTPFLFLGYHPPVNTMTKIGDYPSQQPSYPANLLICNACELVQLGLIVDPEILFPPEYPYTSSTTKILRENFAELAREVKEILDVSKEDLVVDIGSNDGNLLSNFKDNFEVQGVTPEQIGKKAIEKGIPTEISFFDDKVVDKIIQTRGQAKIVTATNVFAHMEEVHLVVQNILRLIKEDGVFISESHYLLPLVETLQYDTVYHEHMRYYSLTSIKNLLEKFELEVFHAKNIPSHGGSIRVYAGRKGKHPVQDTVKKILAEEKEKLSFDSLKEFSRKVTLSKLELSSLLLEIKKQKKKISGIGAPSRASTLINYVALDDGILDNVLEITGSQKIGKNIPGTLVPVLDEKILYEQQPDYALMLSWHIAEELLPKIKAKGFKGDFIIPLPNPRIVKNSEV